RAGRCAPDGGACASVRGADVAVQSVGDAAFFANGSASRAARFAGRPRAAGLAPPDGRVHRATPGRVTWLRQIVDHAIERPVVLVSATPPASAKPMPPEGGSESPRFPAGAHHPPHRVPCMRFLQSLTRT